MSDKESNSSFAVGFLIGAIAGVAIGFLYAPKSGKETRALLREKAGEIKEKAGEGLEAAREAASNVGKKVREKISD